MTNRDFTMAALSARRWYFTTVAVASLAMTVQLLGKHSAGRAMMTMAGSAAALNFSKQYAADGLESLASAEARKSEDLKRAAFQYAHHADMWGGVSCVLALATAAFWVFRAILSTRRYSENAISALDGLFIASSTPGMKPPEPCTQPRRV